MSNKSRATANLVSATGISTVSTRLDISSGPIIIGAATSTGTPLQPLQVTGESYFSSRVGIGTTRIAASHGHLNVNTTPGIASTVVFSFFGGDGKYIYGGTDIGGYYIEQSNQNTGSGSTAPNRGRVFRIQTNNGNENGFGLQYTQLYLDGGNRVIYTNAGTSIGIATTNPQKTFHVSGDAIVNGGSIHQGYASNFGSDMLNILASDGGGISIARDNTGTLGSGSTMGSLSFQSYLNGQSLSNAEAKISAVTAETQSGSTAATNLVFYTKPTGTGPGAPPSERARITSDGYLQVSDNGTYKNINNEFSNTSNQINLFIESRNASYNQQTLYIDNHRAGTSLYSFILCVSGNESDLEFRVFGDGSVAQDGSTSSPADYAEMFEWADGNPNNEDRRGYSVVLVGNKVRVAVSTDRSEDILGVVSGNPAIVGDSAWNRWSDKYLKDEFNCYIWEDHNVIEWKDSSGKFHGYEDWNMPNDIAIPEDAIVKTHDPDGNKFQHRKLNPEYDPTQEYVPRQERKEWSAIGLLGKLRLRKGQKVGSRWIKMRDITPSIEEWLVR